jgi:hypothetical protein
MTQAEEICQRILNGRGYLVIASRFPWKKGQCIPAEIQLEDGTGGNGVSRLSVLGETSEADWRGQIAFVSGAPPTADAVSRIEGCRFYRVAAE